MSFDTGQFIDTNAIDLVQERVRLASDIAVWPVWECGEAFYRIESRDRRRFYRVGYREYVLLSMLDGSTNIAGACGLAASKLGTDALTSDEAESVVVWLLQEGLATVDGAASRSSSQTANTEKSLWKRINPFWIQVPLAKSSPNLRRLLNCFAPLFGRLPTLIGLGAVVCGMIAYGANATAVHQSSGNLFTADGWIYFFVTWVLLKIVHELGHAAACRRLGGEVSEIGIVFMLFAPLAYVDVTSCWRMPKAFSRIMVSLAGMYVELVIASLAMLAWLWCDSVASRFWLANIVVTAGVSTLLFNANPLMRFDGYYVLSDATQIPNLYGEASAELKRIGKWLFYGESPSSGHSHRGRSLFLATYGVAALIWRLMICMALCAAASFMFSGAGILLVAFAVVAWFGQPLKQLFEMTREDFQIDRPRFLRSTVVATFTSAILLCLLFLPFGTSVVLPGVVHDPPGAEIRSAADGFIAEVHVDAGTAVVRGQPIVTLRNESLRAELRDMELKREAARVKVRVATDSHDASATQVSREELRAIERQISELRPKVDGLVVTAPHGGVVSGKQLAFSIGRFVREGEELLRISNAGNREVIAAAHQDQIETVRGSRHQPIQISDVRLRRFETRLKAVQPRASRKLPDPALSALHGGPLQVQPIEDEEDNRDEETRLVEPHFIVTASVRSDHENELPTGTRVRLLLGYRRLSLWDRTRVAFAKFWTQKRQEHEG
ncbi:MAG: efflux RND transporter periplasmic adaptor subunit [Planctomycetota bacterium]